MLGLKKSADVLLSACQGLTLREVSPDLAKAEAAVTSAKERVASLEAKALELKTKLEGLRHSSFDAELACARKHGETAADELAAKHEREIQELDREVKLSDYQARRSRYIIAVAEEQARAAHCEAVRAFRAEFRKRNVSVCKRIVETARAFLEAVKADMAMTEIAERELVDHGHPGRICGGFSGLGPAAHDAGIVAHARGCLGPERMRELDALEAEIAQYEVRA